MALRWLSRFSPRLRAMTTGVLYAIAAGAVIASLFLLLRVSAKQGTQIDNQSEQIKLQRQQLKATEDAVNDTHDDLAKATDTIEADIQCVLTFFSLPSDERASSRIIDLRTCTIINDGTGEQRQLSLPPPMSANPQSAQPSGQQGRVDAPGNGTTSQPSEPSPSPSPSPPPPPPEPEPSGVSGVINNVLDGATELLDTLWPFNQRRE